MIYVYEGSQGLLHFVKQMVVPLFFPSSLVVQEGLMFQKEIPLVLCRLERTFQCQESLQLIFEEEASSGSFSKLFSSLSVKVPKFPKT